MTGPDEMAEIRAEVERTGARLREATAGLNRVSVDRWRQVAHIHRDLLGDEAGAVEADRQAARLLATIEDDEHPAADDAAEL